MTGRLFLFLTLALKNFVVYKSSAGSGKTFTLVKEFLRLSLADEKQLGVNYRRILAVTFTNKAAAEMKSRVISALNSLSKQEPSALSTRLQEELSLPDAELSKRAGFVLKHLLHHYSDLSIGTIDSFTHKIVKTFAHDLKLPVNFNLELDSGAFYERVISSLLDKVGEDEYISTLLKEYSLSRAEENASWDPQGYIEEFSKLLQKENAGEFLSRLQHFDSAQLEEFRSEFKKFSQGYKEHLRTEGNQALDLIRQAGLSDEDFIYKNSGPQKFFHKCAEGIATLDDARGSRLRDALAKNKWAGNGANAMSVETIQPQLNVIAQSLIDYIVTSYPHYALCQLLSRQMYPLMLLKKIEEISAEFKQEERLVFISEFNQRIFDVINKEPTPFIYERLGDRYQHYLLDEFQDTSSLQWQNILPLLDNSLSNGWFNLIVGDGKQSIYRWRNANVKQFAALPNIENTAENPLLEERREALHRNFDGRVLSSNFRSAKHVISFNNDLFQHLSTDLLGEAYRSIYTAHHQQAESSINGYVSVVGGAVARETLDEVTCYHVLVHIQRAVEAGFSPKDICILARTNAHGNTIAGFLISKSIQVVSSDSLLLTSNLEVNTILAYLRYLQNVNDLISAATVLNFLFQKNRVDHEQFHMLLKQLSEGRSLFAILRSCGYELEQGSLTSSNLYDQCIALIKTLNMTADAFHYIRFFLDEVNEFLVQKNSNLAAFFEWWEVRKSKASLIIPDSTDAVKIMTIHASKGLEFPVVIVPYCNWSTFRNQDTWVNVKSDKTSLPVSVISLSQKASDSGFEKELEEETQEQVLDNLNLLYVAFTRAAERLHIICTHAATNNKPGVHQWIMNYAKNSAHWNSDIFELGSLESKKGPGHRSDAANFELAPLAFTAGNKNIEIKHGYLKNEEAELAKKEGILLHWILSQITHEQDIDEVLEQARLNGEIGPGELLALRPKLLNVIAHPLLEPLFSPQADSKIEAELITQHGDVLRPDRLTIQGDRVTLIDYKTGKEHEEKYNRQLKKYEDALLQMGYENVQKYLVYIDPLQVIPVN